ncbi:MAG: flagellar protein export ATPase FliI [Pseudomonadales bacterium]|nr:flagellar protein export ATPase FliI [Pseudomonadales bacterium]
MVASLESREPIANRIKKYIPYSHARPHVTVEGRLIRMVGLTLEAEGCRVPIGGHCTIRSTNVADVVAEVVGFSGSKIYLMPVEPVSGLKPGARVIPHRGVAQVPVGDQLLGRVLDGRGFPLDGKGPLDLSSSVPLARPPINPLDRQPISEPMDVGVRAINSLLTLGRGQRMGLFAGSGVGKSVLLGMMTKYTTADITVVGLVGERGREVKEFIEHILGEEGLRRSIVVASPADDSPLMRMHGAMMATSIAEYFRDQGKNVLLLMDSLTRYAQAQREIALSVGEPPATKGYPPSVFAKLPALVERAGNGVEGGGSITAFYTVLTEGDDVQDPVADSARAILDGHIVLSRRLAEEGMYPAIDVEASISRAMPNIVNEDHLNKAQLFKRLYSRYEQNKDLISVGAYVRGSDPETDVAVSKIGELKNFIAQSISESVNFQQGTEQLNTLFAMPGS